MFRKESRDGFSENENPKRKQAALQTKTQKRWRAKGGHLNALLHEYNTVSPSGVIAGLDETEDEFHLDKMY